MFRRSGCRFADKKMRQTNKRRAYSDSAGTEYALGMTAPLFQSSGDLIADRRFAIAQDLATRGDLAGAADLLAQAIEAAPRFLSAWFALGEVRASLGERDAAIAAFQEVCALD